MDRVSLGIRTHSGWAALIALTGPLELPRLLQRTRLVLADPKLAGSKQPYHAAERFPYFEAERMIDRFRQNSNALATSALREACSPFADYSITGCCLLLSSARPLPELKSILASHALIHTAEGEFFRDAIRQACEASGIPVLAMREREIEAEAQRRTGLAGGAIENHLKALGKACGPPWRQDEKLATLAAWAALERIPKP